MKFLGIDYGKKRVGLALSHKDESLALPEKVLPNDGKLIENIRKICLEKGVGAIVLGESLNFEGGQNPLMEEISDIKTKLESNLNIPIYLEPEFLTTRQASSIQKKDELTDARAAAIILQSFLDKRKK